MEGAGQRSEGTTIAVGSISPLRACPILHSTRSDFYQLSRATSSTWQETATEVLANYLSQCPYFQPTARHEKSCSYVGAYRALPWTAPPQIHLSGGRMLQNIAGKIRALANFAVNVDQYSARCGSILELQSPESPAEVAGQ
jgi:hypothetical protein